MNDQKLANQIVYPYSYLNSLSPNYVEDSKLTEIDRYPPSHYSVSIYYTIFVGPIDSIMRTTIKFAEMLRKSIQEKINESRNDMRESHNLIYTDSLLIEIQTLEWVLGQINQLENKTMIHGRRPIKRKYPQLL